MGNTMITSCYYHDQKNSSMVKLIFYEGETRVLIPSRKNVVVAGEIMMEFPDHMVCHADSFFIGHPIPSLSFNEILMLGETYFVLPLDCFSSSCNNNNNNYVLSASSLASLGSPNPKTINFKECPLQYVKGSDGRLLIKVMPEFIIRLMKKGQRQGHDEQLEAKEKIGNSTIICSTPELKKHYDQLVGSSKVQAWSPKLETISEYKVRYSPCRFIGFERKVGEPL